MNTSHDSKDFEDWHNSTNSSIDRRSSFEDTSTVVSTEVEDPSSSSYSSRLDDMLLAYHFETALTISDSGSTEEEKPSGSLEEDPYRSNGNDTNTSTIISSSIPRSTKSRTPSLSSRPSPPTTPKKRARGYEELEPTEKTYVPYNENDILFGRGTRSNSHPGNKAYRRKFVKDQPVYKKRDAPGKRKMIEATVAWVKKVQKGRFLFFEEETGRYYIASDEQAEEKVKQFLREDHSLLGRALKRSRLRSKGKKGYCNVQSARPDVFE